MVKFGVTNDGASFLYCRTERIEVAPFPFSRRHSQGIAGVGETDNIPLALHTRTDRHCLLKRGSGSVGW